MRYVIGEETLLQDLGVLMLPIFKKYILNELLLETQLSVDLG